MAQTKARQEPEKTSRKPDYVLRVKVRDADKERGIEKDIWKTIGVAFNASISDGQAFSIKIDSPPMQWNGDCLMMPYREFDK